MLAAFDVYAFGPRPGRVGETPTSCIAAPSIERPATAIRFWSGTRAARNSALEMRLGVVVPGELLQGGLVVCPMRLQRAHLVL